jgi:hypothetical protein
MAETVAVLRSSVKRPASVLATGFVTEVHGTPGKTSVIEK